jgi:protein-disulfide isomerase
MDKRFLGILGGLIIIFGVIFAISQNSSNGSSGGNSGGQPTNHVQGQNAKNVTFVEYGDYECPICGAYYQPLKTALTSDVLQNIHFQFRNLPLISIHQNAFAGARAAEAAGLQNKYWQMHDMLYENQNAWSQSSNPLSIFQGYAKQLGLNTAEFKKTGKDQATPTFFINGKYVANSEFSDPSTGAPNADKIQKVINDAITKQSSQSKQ